MTDGACVRSQRWGGVRALGWLFLLLTVSCVHHMPPVSAPDPVVAELFDPHTPLRALAVLPAAEMDPALSDGSLAGAELVRTALWSLPPERSVFGVEGLLWRSEEGADCLLRPSIPGACLPPDWPDPWLDVQVRPEGVRIHVHRGHTDLQGQLLLELPLEQACHGEGLGQKLAERLGIRVAPVPLRPGDAPQRLSGACLTPEVLEPFGALTRALLLSRYGAGPDAPGLDAVIPGPVMPGTLPSLPLLMHEGMRALEARTAPEGPLFSRALLAEVRLELGAVDAAAAALVEPLLPGCGYVEALLALGRIGRQRGALDAASIALGLAARQVPLQEEILAAWAGALVDAERPEDGAFVLRRVLALDSTRLWARRALADALVQAGKVGEARSVLIEGLQRHRDVLSGATLEFELGRLDEAEDAWERALLHHRRGLELLATEGVVQPEAPGRQESHAVRLERGVLLRQRVRSALLNSLGVALLETGRPEDAVEALEEAVMLRTAAGADASALLRANSLYNLGVALARTGAWEVAGERLEAAAVQAGGDDGQLMRIDWARLLHLDQRHLEAEGVLERIRQGGSSLGGPRVQAEWWMVYGLAQGGQGRLEVALDALGRAAEGYDALALKALAGQAWFNAGVIAEHLDARVEAVEAFARAREYALALRDTASLIEIDERLTALGE